MFWLKFYCLSRNFLAKAIGGFLQFGISAILPCAYFCRNMSLADFISLRGFPPLHSLEKLFGQKSPLIKEKRPKCFPKIDQKGLKLKFLE